MSTDRMLSLAAGVCPETDRLTSLRHAHLPAGKPAASGSTQRPGRTLWLPRFAADSTTPALIALDMEPIFVTPDGDHGDRIVEAAAIVGARTSSSCRGASTIGGSSSASANCATPPRRTASGAASSSWRSCRSATCRRRSLVLDAVDRPNASVLIDNLHLARTGGTVADVAAVAPERLPYVQLCDAPANAPGTSRGRGTRHSPHAGRR